MKIYGSSSLFFNHLKLKTMKKDFLESATFSAKNETKFRKDSTLSLRVNTFELIGKDGMKYLRGGGDPVPRRKDPLGSADGWD